MQGRSALLAPEERNPRSQAQFTTSLQSYCDKEMGRIVSQLRTVLKENGQSTELADQVMSTYKAEKSQRYAELKNKLYNG